MQKQTVLNHAKKNLSSIEYDIFAYLLEHLKVQGLPTTYMPVGLHVGLPWEHDCLGGYLANVTVYTHERYGFMLSSMVHVAGTKEPGKGFPLFAWHRGVRINSPLWYEQELTKMIDWARNLV